MRGGGARDGRNDVDREQRGLADGKKRRAGQLLHGAQVGGRGGGVAVNQKACQGDIHLPSLLVVRGVLGTARMGFHQQAGHTHVGAVAMGQTRVAVGAVSKRLNVVVLSIQGLHGLLLQAQLGLA